MLRANPCFAHNMYFKFKRKKCSHSSSSIHKKEVVDRLAYSESMTTTMTSQFEFGLKNDGLRSATQTDQINNQVGEQTN